MPRLPAEPVAMTVTHEQTPTRLVRAHVTPQNLAERARMVLLASSGTGVRRTARQLGTWLKTVRLWLRRWRDAAGAASATFTPERIARSPPWLASGRQKRATCRRAAGAVANLRDMPSSAASSAASRTARSGAFLKEATLQPHRVRGWLTPKPDPDFGTKCVGICMACLKAPGPAQQGIRTVSLVGMSGVQALQRAAPGPAREAGQD